MPSLKSVRLHIDLLILHTSVSTFGYASALAIVHSSWYTLVMDEQEKFEKIKEKTREYVADFFLKMLQERDLYGQEHADALLYTVVGSIISTQINAKVNSANTLDEAGHAYITEKRHVEATVEQAFERLAELINPGTVPEFQCDITMLDTGEEPTGKPH